jgi:hypothetical protein
VHSFETTSAEIFLLYQLRVESGEIVGPPKGNAVMVNIGSGGPCNSSAAVGDSLSPKVRAI